MRYCVSKHILPPASRWCWTVSIVCLHNQNSTNSILSSLILFHFLVSDICPCIVQYLIAAFFLGFSFCIPLLGCYTGKYCLRFPSSYTQPFSICQFFSSILAWSTSNIFCRSKLYSLHSLWFLFHWRILPFHILLTFVRLYFKVILFVRLPVPLSNI